MEPAATIEERLQLKEWSPEACSKAIAGESVPFALGFPLLKLCTIRGIRYHYGFGSELRGLKDFPEFTRALNARSIMSNIIPTMDDPVEQPYCIWHPEVAQEETYRELARRYPSMKYQVGRACAVAGYFDLFRELQLLPEVSIAEEAREIGEKGRAIFDDIMAQPVRYAVMDDYTRTVNLSSPRAGAHLNGDTAVRRLLDQKQKHGQVTSNEPLTVIPRLGYAHIFRSFNLTEDWGIDEYNSDPGPMAPEMIDLFASPLPADLPSVDKDGLILVAAYYGDLDRYVRLRRPKPVNDEIVFIIRGIYHNTPFAKWWSKQPPGGPGWMDIDKAITARFIMNNDLSRVPKEPLLSTWSMPFCIWYPQCADRTTYRALAKRQPLMTLHVVRAAIALLDHELYDEFVGDLGLNLLECLVPEADKMGHPYFLADIAKRKTELEGLNEAPEPCDLDDFNPLWAYPMDDIRGMIGIPTTLLSGALGGYNTFEGAPYDGMMVDFSGFESYLCIPESARPRVPPGQIRSIELEDLYKEDLQRVRKSS